MRSSHPRSSHLRSSQSVVPKASKYLKKPFVYSIKIVNLSINGLKLIAKTGGMKGYKRMSEDY